MWSIARDEYTFKKKLGKLIKHKGFHNICNIQIINATVVTNIIIDRQHAILLQMLCIFINVPIPGRLPIVSY